MSGGIAGADPLLAEHDECHRLHEHVANEGDTDGAGEDGPSSPSTPNPWRGEVMPDIAVAPDEVELLVGDEVQCRRHVAVGWDRSVDGIPAVPS